MRPSDVPDLRDLELFREMPGERFDELMRGAYVQTFPPMVDLITEGDMSDFLHVVLEGRVELFASWNGRETTIATVEPISTFILAATVKDAPYLMSARTLEKSRLILLPSSDVRKVFDADGAFARSVVSELSARYRAVVKNTKNLKLRSSIERLANYVVHQYEIGGQNPEFDLPIEKRKIASFLGMTPENLSRAIRGLRSYGVEFDAQHVTISDLDALRGLAKPSPLIDDADLPSVF
ncbi:transcriptional regulator [Thalassospira mesophila]|uniref:Transcriptional regulator n=2 Tax=Thalassospira mesophila TaxID=1293891 RepID=A0A1Y2KVT4_9PROT|nr:cyclic nucleotide-binding domain-containing protein [Thalassospira mesophila]OSQ36005.1 transcriptional regulator [Thalassospira mesophila]